MLSFWVHSCRCPFFGTSWLKRQYWHSGYLGSPTSVIPTHRCASVCRNHNSNNDRYVSVGLRKIVNGLDPQLVQSLVDSPVAWILGLTEAYPWCGLPIMEGIFLYANVVDDLDQPTKATFSAKLVRKQPVRVNRIRKKDKKKTTTNCHCLSSRVKIFIASETGGGYRLAPLIMV